MDAAFNPRRPGVETLILVHFWGPGGRHHGPESRFYGATLRSSRDGVTWVELPAHTRFQPKVGTLFRDPTIRTDPRDDSFRLVWTCDARGSRFGTARSFDLVHWQDVQAVDVMRDINPLNTWAPKLQWHAREHQWYVFFTSSLLHDEPPPVGNRFWYATTSDFMSFSRPQQLFDWGFGVNDISTYDLGDRYVMFYKCLLDHDIRLTFSRSLLGPWHHAERSITPCGIFSEGPTAFRMGDWIYLYHDRSRHHHMGVMRARSLTDDAWQDVTHMVNLPPQVKHGSVFPVTNDFNRRLEEQIPESPA